MTDLPAGTWSAILVGDEWPDGKDVTFLQVATVHRRAIRSNFEAVADSLQRAQTSSLVDQQGYTIDDLRKTFHRGEQIARGIVAKNYVKAQAYSAAYESMLSLRTELAAIAEEGNKEIEDISTSKLDAGIKTARVIAAIQRHRTAASIAAAKYAGNVLDAMQRILDQQAAGQSARHFAKDHGADPSQMFRPASQDELESRLKSIAEQRESPLGVTPGFSNKPPHLTAGAEPESTLPLSKSPTGVTTGFSNRGAPTAPAQSSPAPNRSPLGVTSGFTNAPYQPPQSPIGGSVAAAPSPSSRTTSPLLPNAASVPASAPLFRTEVIAAEGAAPRLPTAPAIAPSELAQSFNKGLESSAPFSAAAHAVPTTPTVSAEPHVPQPVSTHPAAMPTPQVHMPAADTPPPAHHPTIAEAPQPTPQIVAAAPPVAPIPAAPPVGPLPSYGADLRPPVSTTITPPAPPSAPPPVSAAPASAPVSPSAGQSQASQPALVRHTASSATSAQPSAAGVAARAVAAAATGAVVGAASAEATARERLQRLVNAVARQQPRLAWAAGDRDDETTLLATDLASGWIPPGIELPSHVTLLNPARRRGNLEALLGEVTLVASYTPIHHLTDDDEPPSFSSRPRLTPEIRDLGWELCQATQWRDGLPRLAHTIAKAVSAGTGVLDSEVDLLHQHLEAISTKVLDGYPDAVKAHDIGNWQLLAAIDALIAGDKSIANYHLAWFLVSKV